MKPLYLWDFPPTSSPADAKERLRRCAEFCAEALRASAASATPGATAMEALTSFVRVDVDETNAERARRWWEELDEDQKRSVASTGIFSINLSLVLWTPLHVAAFFNDVEMARVLIDAQDAADIRHRDWKRSAGASAASRSRDEAGSRSGQVAGAGAGASSARSAQLRVSASDEDDGTPPFRRMECILDHAGRLPLDLAREAYYKSSLEQLSQGLVSQQNVLAHMGMQFIPQNVLRNVVDARDDDDDDDDDQEASAEHDDDDASAAGARGGGGKQDGAGEGDLRVTVSVGAQSADGPASVAASASRRAPADGAPPTSKRRRSGNARAGASAKAAPPRDRNLMADLAVLLAPRQTWTREVVLELSHEPRRHGMLALAKFASLHGLVLAEILVSSSAWEVFFLCGGAFVLLLGVIWDKLLFDVGGRRSSLLADDVSLPIWDATSINFLSCIVLLKVLYFREGIDFSLMFLGGAMMLNDAFIVYEELPQLVERIGRRLPDKSVRAAEKRAGLAKFAYNVGATQTFRRFRVVMQYALLFVGLIVNSPSFPLALCIRSALSGVVRVFDVVGDKLRAYRGENPNVISAESAAANFLWVWSLVLASDAQFLVVATILGLYSGTKAGAQPIEQPGFSR